jgi:hypothetical protein
MQQQSQPPSLPVPPKQQVDKFADFFKKALPPREKVGNVSSIPKTMAGLIRLMVAFLF